jgi:hypothetical protein
MGAKEDGQKQWLSPSEIYKLKHRDWTPSGPTRFPGDVVGSNKSACTPNKIATYFRM